MGNTYRIVGTSDGAADVEFGTDGVGYTTVGQVQSGSQKISGDKLELKTRKGNTFCVIYFNETGECQIEAIWDNDYADPARGDAIDLCGLTSVLVEDIEHKWAVGKERSISITARKYAAVTVA